MSPDSLTPTGSYKSWIVIDHSSDGLRAGEGSMVVLNDRSLLLLYSDFVDGGADESRSNISSMTSRDAGRTWSRPRRLFDPPPGALNVMSASVLRLQDGRLGCVFCVKYSRQHLIPQWCVSCDEGESWSTPEPLTDDIGYFVVTNDRLIQHSDGTLIVPYALSTGIDGQEQYEHWDPAWNARCGLFFSRDAGKTWERSPHSITHTPEVFRMPLHLDPSAQNEAVRYMFDNRLGVFQEPGVEELSDGTLMMYIRSSYNIYRCFATHAAAPWTGCDTIRDFHVCMGPQMVRRLPGSDRLMLLYNDRGTQPFGSPEFSMRTPLSVAFSDDGGRSWMRWGKLEDESRSYCYCSLLFDRTHFLTTYYESTTKIDAKGVERRRNLASLKFGIGDLSLFRT